MDCDCKDHQDIEHVHNLAPMYWNDTENNEKFSSGGVIPWLPNEFEPVQTSLIGNIAEMAKLRTQTTPIYVRSVVKDGIVTPNIEVR